MKAPAAAVNDAEYARELQRKLDEERRLSKHLYASGTRGYQEQESQFGGSLSDEQIMEHVIAESELQPGVCADIQSWSFAHSEKEDAVSRKALTSIIAKRWSPFLHLAPSHTC